ncbi:PIP5K4, partial [Symbiodinium necroappetens]
GERQPEGNGSSGGSTYEAVQEEVKRQLRGVVSQLEASRREAQDLRQEVEFLRAEREQSGPSRQLEDMTMPEGPPVTLGGYLANKPAESENGPAASTLVEQASKVYYGYRAKYADTTGYLYADGVGYKAESASGGRAVRTGSDPMSRLLEGLEKVIKGGKPEELSKTVDSPKLPEISESSSVDFGDWLYLIEHVMSDLSTSSAERWARWSRLDRRGATIPLGAAPEDVKKELVATRIESPDAAATVQEAIEGLRQWLRHDQRARDLKLSVPDPSVTLRGIDQLVKKPVQDNPEVAFRMNLLRYHLKVDFSPTEETILAVHRALLAEFEQMGFKKKTRQAQEGSHGLHTNVAFVYGKNGQDLSKAERRDRCYECGAKGHMAMACPTKKESLTTSTTTATPATATEAPVQGVPVEQLIEDAQKLMKAFMEQKTQPVVQTLRVDEATYQRGCESPALREFLKQNEELVRMNRMGLLDSGATHPLRGRTERDQAGAMDNVNVTLAGENRVQMTQNKAGTIIAHQDAQPIVPLGTLVKALGYEFVWDHRGCRLRHPDKKEVRVYTRSACPEVMQCDALRLIAELEEAKLAETMSSLAQLKASVMAAKEYKERSWRDHVQDYVASGVYESGVKAVMCAPFMHHVPMKDQLQTIVPLPKDEGEAWQWMKRFPMNRAKRRRLWQTGEWTVHLFSGAGVKNDPLRDLPGLVEIDTKKGWDLNDDKIYGVLLWMAKEKRVRHVVGGPPAGTFSPWHYKRDPDGRQRALRSTHEPWGLREGLNPDESSKVLNENVMLCKMVWSWLCAEAAHGDQDEGGQYRVGFCMEYPEDPHNYMPEGEHRSSCVSVWRTEFMKEFIKETNLIKHQFEQGALGHMFRRPTCCLSNLGLGIQGLKDQRAYVAADNKDADHSVWPHGFRITLADAIHEWKNGESPIVVKKAMTKKELEEWKTDKGKDEVRGKKYRFVLAATYLYPKMRDVPEDAPIPNEEEAEEFLREEEEEEPEAHELPEDPECEAQEEEWKKKVADLRKPIELQMLRFCIPLERHTGKEILECIQTFTEGLAPTQNAVAESHVKWLKGVLALCYEACGTKTAGIKFGSVVWVKSKKDRGPFDPRWERGRYMGPADDVREGHVVRLDDGLWLRTLHMRTVRDDEMEMEEEEHIVDLIEPTRRMRGKTKLSDPELRAIRKQERAALVKELMESKIWNSPQELKQGGEFKGNYCSMWVNEREVPGQKMSVEIPAKVRPDRLHAPLRGDDGDRIVVIGYTVSKWEKLHQFQCDDLEELGFVLPEREPVVKMMNADGRRRPPTPPIPEENSGAIGPPTGTTAAPPTGATNTVMTSGASFLGPGSSSESTLPRPVSEDHMEVSSGTPAPHTLQSSSSGSRSGQREHLPEMGGERLDSMVVPGGRVELRLKWAIK